MLNDWKKISEKFFPCLRIPNIKAKMSNTMVKHGAFQVDLTFDFVFYFQKFYLLVLITCSDFSTKKRYCWHIGTKTK